ncbi:retrovirus-related Pol polyprotein from transposon 17.6 [Trichonephila clavipes]|nr:retrovirus-related Pol polyprotein from transposon 17.6 [Trichonephila clavipes]
MAFLGKGERQDMLQLAEELGINATLNMTVPSIKIAITNSEGYEEEFVKNLYETIIANGKRLEELERAEKIRLEELVKEQALKEKELQLKFDLERFKIVSGFRVNDESNDSTNACSVTSNLNFKKLIPDFDPKQSDISLYLVIFERQAKKGVNRKERVGGAIIGFKLSPEVFRQKFVQHQKKSDSTWKDFTFEITNYLNEWLIGLEINTFQYLKDLMVVNQFKKRANASMTDHFLDNWANLKSATQIAELFDNYEDVRKVNSKPMDRLGRNDKILTYSGVKEKENRFLKTSSRLGASVPESTRESTFEKRVIQRCYHCNMPGHIKAVCPKLIKNKTTETLNYIEGNENPDFLNSYTTKDSVNGHEIDILRDTGATIDLVSTKYINPSSFSGENVWVKQPFSPELVCLPLVVVEISGSFGTVQTKAADCGNHLNQHEDEILIPVLQEYDQGTSFTIALSTEFFERFGILVRHSSVYRPQSNPVERFHRTFKRLLRVLFLDAGSKWDKHLPSIILTLRTVSHESTWYTPLELEYGKNLRTPETLVMEHWMEPEEESDLVTEYMFKLINRLKRCQEVAINKMEEMQVKRKIW